MDRKGFTLIELLIVVVIIGILAAIALPKFSNMKERAAIASMKADLRNLASVQEAYFMNHNTYAASVTDVQADPYTYRYSGQNTVIITAGSGIAWAASATSPAAGSTTCSLAYGGGSTNDGIIACS